MMMQVAVSLADSFAVIIGDLHLAHMGLDMPQDVVEESVVSVSVAEADSITEAGLTSEARNADQQAAEDRFREARECDRMYEEDSDTKRWLDDLEAEAREAFSQAVQCMLSFSVTLCMQTTYSLSRPWPDGSERSPPWKCWLSEGPRGNDWRSEYSRH
jgi:hypothetical protein